MSCNHFEDEKWTPAYWNYSFCPVICSLWLWLLLCCCWWCFFIRSANDFGNPRKWPITVHLFWIHCDNIVWFRFGVRLNKKTHTMQSQCGCVFFFLHRYYVLCIHYPFEFSENDFGIITSFALNEAIVLLDIDTRFTAAAHHYSSSVNNIRLLHVQPKWHSRGVTIYIHIPYSMDNRFCCSYLNVIEWMMLELKTLTHMNCWE